MTVVTCDVLQSSASSRRDLRSIRLDLGDYRGVDWLIDNALHDAVKALTGLKFVLESEHLRVSEAHAVTGSRLLHLGLDDGVGGHGTEAGDRETAHVVDEPA